MFCDACGSEMWTIFKIADDLKEGHDWDMCASCAEKYIDDIPWEYEGDGQDYEKQSGDAY